MFWFRVLTLAKILKNWNEKNINKKEKEKKKLAFRSEGMNKVEWQREDSSFAK